MHTLAEPLVNSDEHTLVDFLDCDSTDLFEKTRRFGAFLEDWKAKGTYSYHRICAGSAANRTMILDPVSGRKRRMIVLSSNNYLGLNTHPEVLAAAADALAKYGSGMCGSRFLSGTYDLVVELEQELAAFEHTEAAMVFTTGYQANVGTISALARPRDLVLIDRLCHASIVDGCRLSGCALRSFRHNDMADLERLLKTGAGKYRGKLIIVDGVFSMDGDIAPLDSIVGLAQTYGAKVMVDEAHATGVLGSTGRGTVEHFGLHGSVDIVMGTFSKTLAATGGFIAGSRELIDYVRHYGRSYMFSASPTPATTAAVRAALRVLQREPQLRTSLWNNVHFLHQGLKSEGFEVFPDPAQSAVITVTLGPDIVVRKVSKRIYEKGLFASTVAYPAVPRNEGKLRLSLSACHEREDLEMALHVLGEVGREYGAI